MKSSRKVSGLFFQKALEYTTKNNADAVITVGIIKDGQASYTVYGENGKELPKELHTYEIGSLTKTFTAALISKTANERKLNIENTSTAVAILSNLAPDYRISATVLGVKALTELGD